MLFQARRTTMTTYSRKTLLSCSIFLLTLLAVCGATFAQQPASLTAGSANQSTLSSLSNLPEADTLIYISPQRILNDAAPRVLQEAELTKMRSAFGDLKNNAGVDPAKIDYVVIAVRFK